MTGISFHPRRHKHLDADQRLPACLDLDARKPIIVKLADLQLFADFGL
jgi:hypothetical protein